MRYWTWKRMNGRNPRQKLSDDAARRIIRESKSAADDDRFAALYGISVIHARAIRLGRKRKDLRQ